MGYIPELSFNVFHEDFAFLAGESNTITLCTGEIIESIHNYAAYRFRI